MLRSHSMNETSSSSTRALKSPVETEQMRSRRLLFHIGLGVAALLMSMIPATPSGAAPAYPSDRPPSPIGGHALSQPPPSTTDGNGFSEGLIPIQINGLY